MNYIGIDYGEKKIGLAIGNDETRIAVPLEIVDGSDQQKFIDHLTALIARENVGALIVGIPELSKERNREHYKKVKAFSAFIRESVAIPIIEADESFTTKEAQQLLGAKNRGRDDAVAAMLLVQHVLDRRV